MSDYAALAQRVAAGVSGIRGCLLLSRDGMVLGAHPEGEAEASLKVAWLRFVAVGEADRSYIEFPDRTWAFVRRGGYAAFVVADVGVRPGVLVDLLEQVLMAGELERAQDRETMRLPEAPVAPSGKPRTILHKPERPPALPSQPVAATEVHIPEVVAERSAPEDLPPADADADPQAGRPEPDEDAAMAHNRPSIEGDEDTEVDRILLAKEFAGLLQVPKDDDDTTR
jgi:hypothetical protein